MSESLIALIMYLMLTAFTSAQCYVIINNERNDNNCCSNHLIEFGVCPSNYYYFDNLAYHIKCNILFKLHIVTTRACYYLLLCTMPYNQKGKQYVVSFQYTCSGF